MNKIGDFYNNTLAGKAAYNKHDTISESKSSLASFRKIYINSAKAIELKKEKMEEEIKKINSTYVPAKAGPMIAELKKSFNSEIEIVKTGLRKKLSNILNIKREVSKQYIMVVPTAEQLTMLQTLQMRGIDNIPDEEWAVIIDNFAGNYQCASILKTLAKGTNKEFSVPFSLVNGFEDINDIEKLANIAIDNIEDPKANYYANEFRMEEVEDTNTSILIKKLDSEIATTVPDESTTLIGRLRMARDHALHVGDYDTFKEICAFIASNSSVLETPAERERAFLEQAEGWIQTGMNAVEKTAENKYTEHRSEVIEKLETALGNS